MKQIFMFCGLMLYGLGIVGQVVINGNLPPDIYQLLALIMMIVGAYVLSYRIHGVKQ